MIAESIILKGTQSGSIQDSLFLFIIGKLYFNAKILDSDHCIILRKNFKMSHALVTMARYVTHK